MQPTIVLRGTKSFERGGGQLTFLEVNGILGPWPLDLPQLSLFCSRDAKVHGLRACGVVKNLCQPDSVQGLTRISGR